MRIAWIVYGALDQMTGGYVYDAAIVRGLRTRGCDVEVVPLSVESDGAALLEAMLAGGYDVIVGDELCHPELAQLFEALENASRQGRAVPRRVLLVHHLTCWEHAVGSETETRVVARADAIIVTSEMSARRLTLEFGVQSAVCVPGADRLPLHPRSARTPHAALRLLFVGTWTERKGLHGLLQALGNLGDAAYQLTVVGDSARDVAYRQLIEAEFERLPAVAARTHVLGVVSDVALAALYADSDVLVLPSFFEGYGMVLTEALRAGLALVASDVGAIPEVAHEGYDSHLVPPGDIAALATALGLLIATPAELARLQQHALSRYQTTWATTVERFHAALLS